MTDTNDILSVFPVRSATIDVDGLKLNIGIAHGLHNARKLLEDIKAGNIQFHAIKIVACYVRGAGVENSSKLISMPSKLSQICTFLLDLGRFAFIILLFLQREK